MGVDVAGIFSDSLSQVKPMIMQLLIVSMPYLFSILGVTIGLPLALSLFERLIFGHPVTQFDLYKESAESFGGHMMYDEDGELDAIGYGDFDNFEYDDLEDYDESEEYFDKDDYADSGDEDNEAGHYDEESDEFTEY